MPCGYLGHTENVLIPGEEIQLVVVPRTTGLDGTRCLSHADVLRAPPSFHTLPSRAGPTLVVAYRCKRFGVPIEKIYSKTQRERFAWAFERAGEDFEF